MPWRMKVAQVTGFCCHALAPVAALDPKNFHTNTPSPHCCAPPRSDHRHTQCPPLRCRRAGYAKTPDVKLDLPIGIRDPAAVEAARRVEGGAVAGRPGAAAAAVAWPGAGFAGTRSEGSPSGEPSHARPAASAAPAPPATAASALAASAAPRIVHWIDSKAMFGDPLTHRDNLEQVRQRERAQRHARRPAAPPRLAKRHCRGSI